MAQHYRCGVPPGYLEFCGTVDPTIQAELQMLRPFYLISAFLVLGFAAPLAAAQPAASAECPVAAPFSVVKVPVGSGSRATMNSATGNPLAWLRAKCMSPDFIAEDNRALLQGLRLTRPQSDSIAAITKTHLALQKTLTDQRTAQAADSASASKSVESVSARVYYLTPEMRTLRKLYAAAIRATLQPTQVERFASNLVELNKKDPPLPNSPLGD